MPTGVYSSILANRYQAAPGASSSAVLMATGMSLITITILLKIFLV
jgi:predicted permease